ncbi:hypothetical protein [Streptomyces sp. G1]|uniref:hypothetical protein n=1 Tax=Streptomyces sp. G1 TaxID=361572 RepID=UPI002030CF89|nr:hypothetical protein [Streptomyces sp. G1]MCM1964840.1 hypothetical protein [Streptomyces sp. G1]
MPSPNGYFDCGASTNIDRNWYRAQITHDINNPPWDTPNAGSYEFEINIGTAAVGPFTPAPLTAIGNQCNPQPDNRLTVGGVTDTLFGVGGPAELLADTDYWLEIVLYDPAAVEVDRFVCGPTHTAAYPTFVCLGPDTTETSAEVTLGSASGRVNLTDPCNRDTVVWELATSPGGPYTPAPSEPVTTLSPSHTFTGLTAGTTYYYRARFTEQAQTAGEYLVTQECSFTTEEATVTTPPFNPQPCDSGGAGADAVDVEQIVLCDLDAEGNLLGTALAVYEYDTTGAPVGAPTFVDPATGAAYVPQGTLQPCPDAACLPPMQFCQTSTTTGPVEHPGRQYDMTLPINPGFAVQSLQVDAINHPAGITWEVDDPDGEAFRQNLTTFIEGRVPASATVTITNPNAGVPQVCGAAQPMTVHIECVRLDQAPPDLIELVYNGGQDLIQNPAYNESPALNPPVSQGNYGFRLLSRQDDPGPFPGNQPANDALCTSVANRGWETNDVGRTFEIWGQDIVNGSNVTPTPRGTPVQEMTSDGPPPGGLSTIWQTFQAPASGNFIIRVVHGARDPGETHRITLDNGDTDDAQNGDLIDDTTNPPSVTSNGGPNPWTQFSQTIPLNAGSTYTLALSSTNPVAGARGGLFTDMRAYIDRPDQRATAATDDETCVVTTEETQTNTLCSFWQPQCVGGAVAGWQKVDTGETLTNAEFWAQVPTPGCCLPDSGGEGEGSSTLSNMLTSDIVCATVGGIPQNAIRVMVTDPSGGTLQVLFLGTDGAPIAPDSWTAGPCTTSRYMADQVLCDDNGPFLRKYVQSLDATNQAQINSFRDFNLGGGGYTVVGEVRQCGATDVEIVELCDRQANGVVVAFLRRIIFDANGTVITSENVDPDGNPYNPTGTVSTCSADHGDIENTLLCDVQLDGTPVPFLRSVLYLPQQGGFAVAANDWELDGTTPYAVTGTVQVCQADTPDREVVCWTQTSTGDQIHTGTIRHDDALPAPGWILFDQHLTPVSPAEPGLTFVPCGASSPDVEVLQLCDDGTDPATPFLRRLTFDTTGALASTVDTDYDGAPYAVTGDAINCIPGIRDSESVVLCDVNAGVPTRFVRTYVHDSAGVVVAVVDSTFAGGTYTPTGTVGSCAEVGDSESFILCDSAAGTPNRFIRTFTYGTNGAITGFTDTTLAGAPFVPTGAVGVCAQTVQADTDFVEEVLCDQNGTAFIRLFRFNSVTGVLVSTTNTTLAGAAFAPVGTVGLCSDCCPQVVADELCTNTGSGRGTAIRATNGTVTLIDSVTGATITQANIIACPGDDTVVTLTAQGRLVGDADAAWTPGADVAGTLTSVTMTVLSGTATVTDANGTVLAGLPAGYSATWTAEDNNTLTGPQSIDAIGGNTAVVWTQR